MSILQRYILKLYMRNLGLALAVFVFLFIVFDFFDRIDNILPESAPVLIVMQYFLFKFPTAITLMLPIATLVTTMLTIGLLSKNSEIVAMRAAGIKLSFLLYPLLLVGLGLSVLNYILSETLVPYTTRRMKEIYNIDIMQKNMSGSYSQSDFWWRRANSFYSVRMFDSRTNTLHLLSKFEIGDNFMPFKRTDAAEVGWLDAILGWNMRNLAEHRFPKAATVETHHVKSLPLPIPEKPQDFYDVKADPDSLSYRQLKKYIRQQSANGVSILGFMADLYHKLSFPLVNLIIILAVFPFSLRPARSGSMASSFLAGLVIAFSYYAIDSFSVAMGRAELWPAFMSAWMANFLMGVVGIILNIGAESPE